MASPHDHDHSRGRRGSVGVSHSRGRRGSVEMASPHDHDHSRGRRGSVEMSHSRGRRGSLVPSVGDDVGADDDEVFEGGVTGLFAGIYGDAELQWAKDEEER